MKVPVRELRNAYYVQYGGGVGSLVRTENTTRELIVFQPGLKAPLIRSGGAKPEPLPDRRGQPRLVQRVEVQPRRAVRQQVGAQARDHVEAEGADRRAVVAEALELAAASSAGSRRRTHPKSARAARSC